MRRRPPGRYVTVSTAGEASKVFVPAPLPPKPALVWSPNLRRRFDDGLVALGRLDAITSHLPSVSPLLYSFVRKEAVLSSQIEGTQSSLADLLLYEADEEPGVPVNLQYGAETLMSVDRPNSAQVAQAAPSAAVSVDEKEAIHNVISGYYDAFGRDSAAASAFYGEPTLIVLPSDVIILGTRTDVESYLGKTVASLKPSGYSHSKLGTYRITLLNSTTALYSTVAIRIRADGTEMQRSGFTYLLRKNKAGWRIHGIIPTDLDKLISAD